MKKFPILAAFLCVCVMGGGPLHAETPVEKPVVVEDPALDALISADAKMQELTTGFGFAEGIVWMQKKGKPGYLLMSDIPANVIFKITADGKQSLFLDRSGYTGYDIWRVGFMQNNGRDKSDPK